MVMLMGETSEALSDFEKGVRPMNFFMILACCGCVGMSFDITITLIELMYVGMFVLALLAYLIMRSRHTSHTLVSK